MNIQKKAPIDDTVPHQNSLIPGLILYFGGFAGGSQLPVSDAILLVFPQCGRVDFTPVIGETGENAQVINYDSSPIKMHLCVHITR